MHRGRIVAATAIAATLTVAAAPASADERLKRHPFDPEEVVQLDGKLGVQATIAFGEGETIENVAVGDAAAWQITPNKRANLLFVKPLEAGARTNMTVVTDRHTYFFDLVASGTTEPVYMLRFTYDAEIDASRADADALAGMDEAVDARSALAATMRDVLSDAPSEPEPGQEGDAEQAVAQQLDDTGGDPPLAGREDSPRLRAASSQPVVRLLNEEKDAVPDRTAAASADGATVSYPVVQALPVAENRDRVIDRASGDDALAGSSTEDEFALAFGDVSTKADAPEGTRADALNFAWSRSGDSVLLPRRVFDDGASTFLVWDDAQALPEILIRNAEGEENAAIYGVRGQTIVINQVPGAIVLRNSEGSALLENLRSRGIARVGDAERRDPSATRPNGGV